MNEVAGELIETAHAKRRIIPALWPEESFRDFGPRGDLSEFAGARTEEEESFTAPFAEAKFIDTVADVMHRRMATDDRIVIPGEDVHPLKAAPTAPPAG
ncbi:hypothetical protein KTN05_07575 [Paracoccus sp. Z118]|nr:hypothetical protein [Paracoccus sp. Z118]